MAYEVESTQGLVAMPLDAFPIGYFPMRYFQLPPEPEGPIVPPQEFAGGVGSYAPLDRLHVLRNTLKK